MTVSDSETLHRVIKDLTVLLEPPKDASDPLRSDVVGSLLDGVCDFLKADCAYARFELPVGGLIIEEWRPQSPKAPPGVVECTTTPIVQYDAFRTASARTSGDGTARVHAWIPGVHGVLVVRSSRRDFPDEFERFYLQAVVDQATAALRRNSVLIDSGVSAGAARPTLVGRNEELSHFQHWVGRALAGEGCVVLVEGAAGIGKSALVNEVCVSAGARGMLVLGSRCYRTRVGRPFSAWNDIFKRGQELAELFRLSLPAQPVNHQSTHASPSVRESMA
ncbi:MAG TPA: ATP-binding protein [Gemmataceae bacterium]|nr:ATP-binding protein [Gemmataceae bacterium]